MSAGDKFVVATALVIGVGWIGYEAGYDQGHGRVLECSPRQADGRPLLNTIRESSGRVVCVYADPMPQYEKRGTKPWT